ncbi:leucine-rich repeat protein [Faecalibacterium prausnitzii]|uniref:leucine-rich repeat protein n=1 Tax=Faecalibacterium prausnitzii TaxID=853 RepID=UPI0012E2F94F
MKKRLISLLVALCMAVTLLPVSAITAWAEDPDPPKSGNCGAGDGSGVTWQLTKNTDDPSTYKLTISGSGAMKDFHVSSYQPWHSFRMQITSVVILPGVTSIGECAFSWFSKLTHVDIADSVISIGWNAFRSCSSLTDITIPQSVTYIGGLAFSYCTTLTSITIPGSVTSIGSNVFDGCTRLENIYYLGTNESVINNLPADKTTLCSARVTFDYGDKVPEAERMITVSVKTGETLTAPTTPPTVSGYEFKGWLTDDDKPYDFTVAPTGKFTLYANWEKIPDPDPPKSGKCGAAGDGSDVTWRLTENTDGSSTYTLTISGSGAMEDYLMSGHQPWCSFRDQITSVVVSPGVTSIGDCAFTMFSKLTHVDIADSVISIGDRAFSYCSSLTDIKIPQSVTYIGGVVFRECTNLSSITLSNNITSIGPFAFEKCTNLTSITIPGSVTAIGPNAFEDCTNLTSITIPGSVTSISRDVFAGCTRLNDIRYFGTSESVISALSQYLPTRVTFNYGDKVPEAERMITVFVKTGGTLTAPTTPPTVSGYEFKGWLTEDGELYDFPGAPTGQLTLYANWEKIPDPKPEPEPDPTPETPTYTLTVKGGTFTYNGGEAMTSARVPVDAEVKVTLNQSAVPEGMVFDLWAMDEASLLGNPAVAYNEESFTIPAGSVAKGSTVTVEAQYRDATIESEPSILGTAAIIGVAGAGTAVIVWQGYRIGMELYEKYFQPTPEETAAEQPAPEAPAAAAAF